MDDTDFCSILTTLKLSDTNQVAFSETWSQGRAAFGGLAAAFAVCGMNKIVDPRQSLRSLMISFVAPLPPGMTSVQTQLLRQGKSVSQTAANVLNAQGEVCLQALAAYGHSRKGRQVPAEYAANLPAKTSGVSFADHKKRLPGFLQHFAGQWTGTGIPFTGTADRKLNMWVKHRASMTDFAAEKILSIADIPPPVLLSHYEHADVPASSLSWSLEFVIPPEQVQGNWFYLDFYLEAAADGYTQQSGKVFDESGSLCALTRQCMVYFDQPRA